MSKKFFNYKPEELDFVVFDIETTGFKAGEDDFVTTIIAHYENKYHIWLNTDGDTSVKHDEMLTNILEQSSTINNISLSLCLSETQLFRSFTDFLEQIEKDNVILTAFNGETYAGHTDFDLPFLRTRFFANGIGWPFKGFWYSDTYEIFSKKNRIKTTVTGKPTLDDLTKSELHSFIDDKNIDVNYSKMSKSDIINQLENSSEVTDKKLKKWGEINNKNEFNIKNLNKFNKSDLQKFIDDMDVNISYHKLRVSEIREQIRNSNYTEDMILEWYNETGREVGTRDMTTLDGIHEKLIESRISNSDWVSNLPFKLEIFEPIDPYEDSSEAVEGFKNKEYDKIILHCLADVARTVNLTRLMIEYTPQQDYRPKTL